MARLMRKLRPEITPPHLCLPSRSHRKGRSHRLSSKYHSSRISTSLEITTGTTRDQTYTAPQRQTGVFVASKPLRETFRPPGWTFRRSGRVAVPARTGHGYPYRPDFFVLLLDYRAVNATRWRGAYIGANERSTGAETKWRLYSGDYCVLLR